MMKKTIVKELFYFDELSDDAKEKALQDFLAFDYYDCSEWEKTLQEAARLLQFSVRDWNVDCWRARIDYRPEFSDEVAALSGPRLLSYVWNNCRELWPGKYYSTPGKYIDGKYNYKWRRSKAILADADCPLTGVCYDCAITSAVNKLWSGPVQPGYTYADLVRDAINNLEQDLAADYEYFYSMDRFREICEANDYVFTADGKECYLASEADKEAV